MFKGFKLHHLFSAFKYYTHVYKMELIVDFIHKGRDLYCLKVLFC